MKVTRLVLLFGLSLIAQLVFADVESEKEADRLLATMGLEGAMIDSMSQMVDLQLQQNPELAPYKSVMMEFSNKHMSWESLRPEFLKIYSDAFTATELREITKFYETETGKKTITLMPSLIAQGGQIGAARVQANIGELRAMIKAESERLKEEAQ